MKKKSWDDLPASVRGAAVGAAGRALIAEVCGLELRSVCLSGDKGVCKYFKDSSEEWIGLAVDAAEPAARAWYFNANTAPVDALAKELGSVFENIGRALHPVAELLAERSGDRVLRAEFLYAVEVRAGAFRDKAATRTLRAKCETAAREVISKNRKRGVA